MGRAHAGAAAAVQNGDDEQWVFVGSVCNQEITHQFEAHGTSGQIGTVKAMVDQSLGVRPK